MLVIVGLWMAIIGYGVLYTGVQKLAGDPKFTLRKAFSGQAASTSAQATQSSSTGSPPATPGPVTSGIPTSSQVMA